MDEVDVEPCDQAKSHDLTVDQKLQPFAKESRDHNDEPLPNFKIVAVQSLAGNENVAQNFLSEMDDELKISEEKRPKLKMVPIASLKSPITVTLAREKLVEQSKVENETDDDDDEQDDELHIKRFRLDKHVQPPTNLSPKLKPTNVDTKSPADEIDGELRPSGSSRRKSRITTRNAEFDEPSMINNVVVNAVREELVQKARELPHGSKTELELMRNVAFLRVCVNHILTKIGKRPITYDRNNQTLASLIQKYSKS